MEKICKIVYFDEDSVTDYVQIVAGGELENTTELLKSRDAQEAQSVQANGKVGISGIFKALLGWEAGASADVSAGLSFNSSKMVKNIVKNTILTDFLKTIEDVSQGRTNSRLPKGTIKQFKGYKISAVEDSLSYMVMVSPYLSMLKSGSSIPAGEFNIAVDKLDNALRHAKGYYEFVGTKGRSRVILRFNINSFRNSYTISDLLKMDLSIYAIKVGRTSLENLNVNKELGMKVSLIPHELSGAVNQVLNYRDNLTKSYYTLCHQSASQFEVLSPKCVVIIGKLASMNSTQIAAFESFRNSLSGVQILTFDELYQRVIDLIAILSETPSPTQHTPKLEDEGDEFPF